MRRFVSDDIELAFIDEGAGDPILLIHGFASSIKMNWTGPGWVDLLTDAGYRVIAFDNRGHGDSQKLYGLKDYGAPIMAEDARSLLDHLEIERADVMGYSMGARITAFLAMHHPKRVRSCIFGGLGYSMIRPMAGSDLIAEALEADTIDDVATPIGQTFRRFAEQTGSDLKALATCMRSAREPILPEALAAMEAPVLVAVGSDDDIAGSAKELAAIFRNGQALEIAGRDHMRAVGDKIYKQGVLQFLQSRS